MNMIPPPTPATDERGGLPSASGLERLAACPGSWALERTQPPEPESDDATSGTRIHAALARCFAATPWRAAFDDDSAPLAVAEGLTDDEALTFAQCVRQTVGVVEGWATTGEFNLQTEQREWLFGPGFRRILSGQYDLLITQGRRALVIDFKTGRGEQPESARNLQLRALAVLVRESADADDITVAIVQPWASSTPALCQYTDMDLWRARGEIIGILDAAGRSDAPRVAGEKQCRFCRAKAVCPEAQAAVGALALVNGSREVAAADLPRLLDLAAVAKQVIESLEGRAKRMLEADPSSVPGYCLKPGAAKRTVTNAQAAFTALADKLTPEQFTGCCTVKISELETTFRMSAGLSVKDARTQFDARLNGSIETKQNAPSLARVKQK